MVRQALIPAAGRGARLDRPGTPKPLVDVAGEAMLVRTLRQLQKAGVERAVVVVGYRGAQIARKLSEHPDLDLEVVVVKNPKWKDGIASSILCAKDAFHEPFLLAMADHVFDDELVNLMMHGEAPEGGVLSLVDPRVREMDLSSAVTVRRVGDEIVDIGRNLRHADAVDTGLFVATPGLFAALEESVREGNRELFDGIRILATEHKVRSVSIRTGQWNDVDSPADLVRAEMRLRDARRENAVHVVGGSTPALEGPRFDLITVGPATTVVALVRGAVSHPERANLIPDRSASSPIFVFTDETVNRLYGERFVERLRRQGYDVQAIVLPEGEEAKTLSNYVYLVERVLARGVDERSVFISLGGGVVCNVCGFVASTIYRGLELVHVPTTLMAQCDAAISHKQAINGHRGKNMVGSYFAPRLVAVDVEVLATLSTRLLRDGLAEAIKHALAQDPAYVEMLLSHAPDLDDLDFLEAVVRRNVELKCDLVRSDGKELREGVVLQYGHTFGHPLEHLSGYRLLHGESVAIGMMIAARVARVLGACRDDLVDLHERVIGHFGLPTEVPANIATGDVLRTLRYNKRYLTEGTRMALLTDVGKVWSVGGEYVIPVSERVLAEALDATRTKTADRTATTPEESCTSALRSSPVRLAG